MKLIIACFALSCAAASVGAFPTNAFIRRGIASQPLHVASASPIDADVGLSKVEGVTIKDIKHELFFVDSINDIDAGKPQRSELVDALELTNIRGVSVKCMAQGGNMVGLTLGDTNYIWDNVEGACYYGPESDAFPLKRGLILHGGVRFAAICAEHGLYYDTDWDMTSTSSADGTEKSIVLKIQDTQENRDKAAHGPTGKASDHPGLSSGPFGRIDVEGPLSKYPVTDMIYTYTVTLREDEDFVRLNMKVENPTDETHHAEAWLPMTFPIDEDSHILSDQDKRWRRDEWCFPEVANIVDWKSNDMKDFNKPLDWPTSGIFYDYPSMDGTFHGVTTDQPGKGIFYVAPDTTPHFTKMWSWGDKKTFDRQKEIEKQPPLGAGRPYTEYYEPWSSGFNFAFFQTSQFEPKMSYSWEIALLPIESGLDGDDNEKLKDVVRGEINKRDIPSTLSGVVIEPME